MLLAILQPAISLSLRWMGYKRTRRLLAATSRREPRNAAPADMERAERLALLANIAGRRGPVRTTCLRQALAVHWMLRRRGLQPQLLLGVGRLEGAAPDMHAWVELQGTPLAQENLRHTSLLAEHGP